MEHDNPAQLVVQAPPAAAGGNVDRRLAAVRRLREEVQRTSYPLPLPGVERIRTLARTLGEELDDYVLPRLRRAAAPVLAVVGGSTGAGKSTLLNSLIRAPVSPAGVLRPTTRSPLLACHPDDVSWFAQPEVLPGLARSSRPGEQSLQVIHAPALRPGLALLDAPDIDSVVAHNRSLARELLGAADLWLFVTTAARYADALPWAVLREGSQRGTPIAIILDRVPDEEQDEISGDCRALLAANGFERTPLFVLSESTLDRHGLLAELDVAPVKRWVDDLARDPGRRRQMTQRTLLATLSQVHLRVRVLVRAAEEQAAAVDDLTAIVRQAYGSAMSDVEGIVTAGAALRGNVYARWREMVTSGEARQALRPRRAHPDDAGADPLGRSFLEAVASALVRLIVEADAGAAQRCADGWRAHPAGRVLLAADPSLGRPWRGFTDAAHDLVFGWQTWLRLAVGEASAQPYSSAARVLVATVGAVAPPREEITSSSLGASTLRAVLDGPDAREVGARARAELLARLGELLSAEVDRHLAAIAGAGVDPRSPHRLGEAARSVEAPAPSAELGPAA